MYYVCLIFVIFFWFISYLETMKIIGERKYFVNEIRLIRFHFPLTYPYAFVLFILYAEICVYFCTCWCVVHEKQNKTTCILYIYRYTNSPNDRCWRYSYKQNHFSSWNFRLTYELSTQQNIYAKKKCIEFMSTYRVYHIHIPYSYETLTFYSNNDCSVFVQWLL